MTNNHAPFELRRLAPPVKCRLPANCALLDRPADTALAVGGVNVLALLAGQPEAIRPQAPV